MVEHCKLVLSFLHETLDHAFSRSFVLFAKVVFVFGVHIEEKSVEDQREEGYFYLI